ncbi:MAG: MBL fold metallo-hydrolase [Actinomycetota bacterium]|nr:MBL fold metallo-hydrolase [Actinomycetota bacterium]MDA3027237.1 MBL fold metallo-hydrolase [Actinomycetota bacterium]
MAARVVDWAEQERRLSEHVSVLVGDANGGYPSGNSVLVRGAGEAVIIDPSVTAVAKGGAPVRVDAMITSHGHEDHLPGTGLFTEARVHVHEADKHVLEDPSHMLDAYQLVGDAREEFRQSILTEFNFAARPDAEGFHDGHVWSLGGVDVEAVHLPGHTAGHSGFRISEGVFFLSDIDLTGFGPYYGDTWSSLDDFENSLIKVRDEEADYYVTFHQKGVIEGRERFLEMVDAYHAVIHRRHTNMLEFLSEPRTIAEMVAHRFVYRPHVEMSFCDSIEGRTAELHVARMLERGEAVEVEPGRYRAA